MRSSLASAMFLGLVGIIAGPSVAEAMCVQPCHEMICVGAQTVLETTTIDSKWEYTTFRIDAIHGLDDGSMQVGDTVELYLPNSVHREEGIWFFGEQGAPIWYVPTRSGELSCPRSSKPLLDVETAIELALSEDCSAAAEEVLGPIPKCNDTIVTLTPCTTGPGAANLLVIAFAVSVFSSMRRRRPGR